ncbi:MAG: single-stranded DNA-binding protein [Patescibacteria group bacterium]
MSSRSLNRIVLIGNLTRDPELKYTPTGTAVCTFSIATNRSWTSNDGQAKEEVQYHRVVAWQKLAELCGKLLNKGRKVFAEGRMTYRTFTGKDGILRTIAEIVLDDFIVFGEGRKMAEAVVEDKKIETVSVTEETKSESSKEETVNPDDIPF